MGGSVGDRGRRVTSTTVSPRHVELDPGPHRTTCSATRRKGVGLRYSFVGHTVHYAQKHLECHRSPRTFLIVSLDVSLGALSEDLFHCQVDTGLPMAS